MADTLKNLGQLAPAATTLTALYTVPGATSATVSSVVVCNRSGTPTTFRLSHSVGGAADSNPQYLYYDLPIPGNETFILTVGLTMATGDILRAYAGAATLSFNAYGVEVT